MFDCQTLSGGSGRQSANHTSLATSLGATPIGDNLAGELDLDAAFGAIVPRLHNIDFSEERGHKNVQSSQVRGRRKYTFAGAHAVPSTSGAHNHHAFTSRGLADNAAFLIGRGAFADPSSLMVCPFNCGTLG
jgi:hypothetical protein